MPFDLTTPRPLKAAVESVSAKTPIGAALRTKGWQEKVAAGLQNGAIWSAGVETVKAVDSIQKGVGQILGEVRDARHGGYAMDRGKLIAQLQKQANALGLRTADPEKRGGLQDYGSERRLKLILEMQIAGNQAKAFWEQGNDPDIVEGFPALRLIRVRESKAKRDWDKRWKAAAAEVKWEGVADIKHGMIALKSSPIWRALSRFKRPWPPFDFNSGMGVEEVDREHCDAIGLTKPGQKFEDPGSAWEEHLQASVKGLAPENLGELRKMFGDQIHVDGDGVATWKRKADEAAPIQKLTAKEAKKGTKEDADQGEQRSEAPAVVPVRGRLKMNGAPKRPRLEAVNAAVDELHGLPSTAKLYRVVPATSPQAPQGEFAPDAGRIYIRADAERPELSYGHELGHVLAHEGFGDVGKAAELAEWRAAMEQTKAVQALRLAQEHFGPAGEDPSPAVMRELDYLTTPAELFARSYAQWIATKGSGAGAAHMRYQIKDLRERAARNKYWEADDFAPVLQALEKAITEKGWMR